MQAVKAFYSSFGQVEDAICVVIIGQLSKAVLVTFGADQFGNKTFQGSLKLFSFANTNHAAAL